jgi:hypothetical protein
MRKSIPATVTTVTTVAIAAALLVTACTSAEAAVKKPATATVTAAVTFETVGDSITDPGAANNVPDTWLKQLSTSSDTSVKYIGGYNHYGYTCGQLAPLVPNLGADVLVIECGTNDINHGVSTADTLAAIDAIRAASGASHVLLVPTPPNDNTAAAVGDRSVLGSQLNRQLIARAWGRGWLYADPFYVVRDPSNHYEDGTTVDGTHGTLSANYNESTRFSTYIKQAAQGAKP